MKPDDRKRHHAQPDAVFGDIQQGHIVGECTCEESRKEHADAETDACDDGCDFERVAESLLHAAEQLCAVIVADDRLRALVQADNNHDDDHEHGVEDAECAHRKVAAVPQQRVVEQHRHPGGRHLHEERRHADGDDGDDDPLVQPNVFLFQPDGAFGLIEVIHHEDHSHKHGDDRGPGHAGNAHFEHENKYRIQNHVQYCTDQHGVHGLFGISGCTHHAVEAITKAYEHVAGEYDLQILACIGQRIFGCTKRHQDIVEIDVGKPDDENIENEDQQQRVPQDFLGRFFISLAEADGDSAGCAHAHQHPERRYQYGDGKCDGESRNSHRPHSLADENAIDNIVERVDQSTDNCR